MFVYKYRHPLANCYQFVPKTALLDTGLKLGFRDASSKTLYFSVPASSFRFIERDVYEALKSFKY